MENRILKIKLEDQTEEVASKIIWDFLKTNEIKCYICGNTSSQKFFHLQTIVVMLSSMHYVSTVYKHIYSWNINILLQNLYILQRVHLICNLSLSHWKWISCLHSACKWFSCCYAQSQNKRNHTQSLYAILYLI